MRVVETAIKTGLENRLIVAEAQRTKKTKPLQGCKIMEEVDKIHEVIDKLANQGFGTASIFSMPLATGRTSGMTQVNLAGYNELKRVKRNEA